MLRWVRWDPDFFKIAQLRQFSWHQGSDDRVTIRPKKIQLFCSPIYFFKCRKRSFRKKRTSTDPKHFFFRPISVLFRFFFGTEIYRKPGFWRVSTFWTHFAFSQRQFAPKTFWKNALKLKLCFFFFIRHRAQLEHQTIDCEDLGSNPFHSIFFFYLFH